jgi:hypothetical protein
LTNPHKPAVRTTDGGLYAFYAGAARHFFGACRSFDTRSPAAFP